VKDKHPHKMQKIVLLGIGCLLLCVMFFGLGDVGAQSGVRKMIENRSLPDRLSDQAISTASNFSPEEVRILDRRSIPDVEMERSLTVRSEFTDANMQQIATRSEFSSTDFQMLEKRSAPDITMYKQVQNHSTPGPNLLRRDQVIDAAFLMVVQKQSEMNPEEHNQLAKTSDPAAIQVELRRNSVAAASYSRILSKRSEPESTFERLLRARSVD